MSTLIILLIFVAGIAGGIVIGKLLFAANAKSEKASIEERLAAVSSQYEFLKQQFAQDKASFEKMMTQANIDKETIRAEKDSLALRLTKTQTDFENLWQKNLEQKEEVEKLQEKFTKDFENLANKIMEEKSQKFTEQNKENMKNILTPLQEKITRKT
jgi:DNA recombination protein RmuC